MKNAQGKVKFKPNLIKIKSKLGFTSSDRLRRTNRPEKETDKNYDTSQFSGINQFDESAKVKSIAHQFNLAEESMQIKETSYHDEIHQEKENDKNFDTSQFNGINQFDEAAKVKATAHQSAKENMQRKETSYQDGIYQVKENDKENKMSLNSWVKLIYEPAKVLKETVPLFKQAKESLRTKETAYHDGIYQVAEQKENEMLLSSINSWSKLMGESDREFKEAAKESWQKRDTTYQDRIHPSCFIYYFEQTCNENLDIDNFDEGNRKIRKTKTFIIVLLFFEYT